MAVGCGLPLFIQTSCSTIATSTDKACLSVRLRIEEFRLRVSSSLSCDSSVAEPRERLSHYRLLNSDLRNLESQLEADTQSFSWYLCAARLHLHAFYLFDDASSAGYNGRIMELHQTAKSLIGLTLELDKADSRFLSYCPFFCCQVFVCAAFVVLKIATNSFFRTILDIDESSQLLERSITALRRMSVVNNDIPARLGDVLAFFCALPDPATVGGHSVEDLRLKQVNTRLSMSVVHDFLRTWRNHFRKQNDEASIRGDGASMGDKCRPLLFMMAMLTRYEHMNPISGDFQDMMGFDFPMGMANFFDVDLSF